MPLKFVTKEELQAAHADAFSRKRKVQQTIRKALVDMGHKVTRDTGAFLEFDGVFRAYEISEDETRIARVSHPNGRLRIKFPHSRPTVQYPEPKGGWSDERLLEFAAMIHKVIEDEKLSDVRTEERRVKQEAMTVAAQLLNKELQDMHSLIYVNACLGKIEIRFPELDIAETRAIAFAAHRIIVGSRATEIAEEEESEEVVVEPSGTVTGLAWPLK